MQRFPEQLQNAPMLLPVSGTPLRRAMDDYFERLDLQPAVIAEFDDSALMKAFGEGGTGIFPAPAAITEQVERMYRVRKIGDAEGVMEHYYAISPERKLKHPAVVWIIEAARAELDSV
jgi:LysR family transcriptional activator of nhaA